MSSCKASWHKPTEDYYKPSSYSQSNSRYPNLKFPKDENPTCSVAVIRFAVVVPRAAQGDEHIKNCTTGLSRFHAISVAKLSGKVVYLDIFASSANRAVPKSPTIRHYRIFSRTMTSFASLLR